MSPTPTSASALWTHCAASASTVTAAPAALPPCHACASRACDPWLVSRHHKRRAARARRLLRQALQGRPPQSRRRQCRRWRRHRPRKLHVRRAITSAAAGNGHGHSVHGVQRGRQRRRHALALASSPAVAAAPHPAAGQLASAKALGNFALDEKGRSVMKDRWLLMSSVPVRVSNPAAATPWSRSLGCWATRT
jgi:hypothetical protein